MYAPEWQLTKFAAEILTRFSRRPRHFQTKMKERVVHASYSCTVSLQLRDNTSDNTHASSSPPPTITAKHSLSYTLVLNFEIAVRLRAEVTLVEVMYAHETVLSTGRIAVALRRNRNPDDEGLVS